MKIPASELKIGDYFTFYQNAKHFHIWTTDDISFWGGNAERLEVYKIHPCEACLDRMAASIAPKKCPCRKTPE